MKGENVLEQRKICEFVTFVPGINPTRAEKQFGKQDIDYYDQAAFDRDYNHEDCSVEFNTSLSFKEDISLCAGDVVISNSMQLAAIVGNCNAGKVPSLNFTKVEFNDGKLDKKYFAYLFNAYSGVKRQKEKELQGTGYILRIPIKALNEIIIPIVSMKEQQKIGKAYSDMLKMQSKLTKYSELLEKFVGAVLEGNLKEYK